MSSNESAGNKASSADIRSKPRDSRAHQDTLTPEYIWTLIEPKLTPDGLWKILEPKVSEYFRLGRFIFWIVSGLISIFVSAIIAVFAIPGVKGAILKAIIDVDAQAARYLNTSEGRDILEGDIENYLRNEKGQAFNMRFKNLLETELSRIVAYSYSIILQISETRKSYDLPYNKPDKNEGTVECIATYPSGAVRNAIFFRLNDQENYVGTIKPNPDSHRAHTKFQLAKNNVDLYFREIAIRSIRPSKKP